LVVLALVASPLVRVLGLGLRLRLLIYSRVVVVLARLLVVVAILILTIVVGLGNFIGLGCLQVPTWGSCGRLLSVGLGCRLGWHTARNKCWTCAI